jgi:hypothetical protein
VHDAARQTLGDGGLADAGFADEERVILLPPAQHLDGTVDLGLAADQRIDFALARLFVEINAIGIERIALLLRLIAGFGVGVLVGAAHRPRFRHARPLGDAVADIIDRVVTGHVLLLQEIGGMAFALGENRDQHIGAGHLLAAGRLDVNHRSLNDTLKTRGRLRIVRTVGHQIVQLRFQISDKATTQFFQIDVARAHDRGSVLVFDQRKEKMLERRIFVVPLIG